MFQILAALFNWRRERQLATVLEARERARVAKAMEDERFPHFIEGEVADNPTP